jgi:hypothetical protein
MSPSAVACAAATKLGPSNSVFSFYLLSVVVAYSPRKHTDVIGGTKRYLVCNMQWPIAY